MNTNRLRRSTFANVMSALALLVALGGGAHAVGLGKDSVRSKQIKDGQVRTTDVRADAITGAKVAPDALTGADIDESTLNLPQGPAPSEPPVVIPSAVYRSPKLAGTLTGVASKLTEVTIDAPAAGYVDATVSAQLNGSAGSEVIDVILMRVSTEVARGYWNAGDADGILDISQSAHGVIPVTAGTHTFKLFVGEYSTGAYSQYADAQLILRYFPEGAVG